MTPYSNRMTPLVKRMAEDMLVRNFAPSTIDSYTYQVDKFQQHFEKPIDELGEEEIRQYQLHLVQVKQVSWSSFNQAVCGLRFLYEVTLRKPWTVKHIPFGKRPKRLPTVLGDEEVQRLLEWVSYPKHRMVLLYLHCRRLHLDRVPSPIDWLPIRQCPKWIDPCDPNPFHPGRQHPTDNPPPADQLPEDPIVPPAPANRPPVDKKKPNSE